MKKLTLVSKLVSMSIVLTALVMLVSCGGGDKKTDEDKDSIAVADTGKSETEKIFYKIPSPAELYMFLRDQKVKFNKDLLNPIENVSKYNTTDKKAMNFGVYASELAYCSLFEQNQKTLDCYSVAKKLADELGLMEGFDENIAKRIDKNINNSDSLYKITSEAYWTAFNYVEAQDKTNILPYIVFGSWIESVYIAVNSTPAKFSSDHPIIVRIVEQEFLLENLISFITTYKERQMYNEILVDLKDLLSLFEELYTNSNDVLITKEQLAKITKKVTEIRNNIVK